MLRTITYNVFGGDAYPAHRHNQDILARFRSQLPERIALELALYEPDIVTFQECPSEGFADDVAARLDMHHAYFPGGWSGAVLSRYPILESENCPLPAGTTRPPECFTRHWGRAMLESPTGPLHLYSAHLHPEHHDTRMAEISVMLEVMQPHIHGPAPLLLQGDLNHIDTTPEYHRWAAAGLQDAFAQAGEGERESWSSLAPRQALDYIWAGGTLRNHATHCRTLNEGAFRPHTGNPASLALSDHLPVLAVFS
jgi:endonuclease/exonuclease/phosphatase family metal-dependent hydrolase